MDVNKAAYWIILGVLALGLNSEYQQGRFVALHRAADRADSALCRILISTRAGQTLAVARALTGHGQFPMDNLSPSTGSAETMRAQREFARDEVRSTAEILDSAREQNLEQIRARAEAVRAQAELRRAEIEQIRWRSHSQFRLTRAVDGRVTVVCPKIGVRVAVNADRDLVDFSGDDKSQF